MPNTAKQEAIRKAYGEYWEQVKDKVDEEGWFYYYSMDYLTKSKNYSLTHYLTCDEDIYKLTIRPKSLQGIENNNGWIRIESEGDLPKDSYNYYAFCSNGSVMTFNDFEYYKKYIIPELKVTHYQPIVKPEKPIY
ncbi:hypothetical protein [Sphingobacterium lactis]|uniref:Uncharacterized protein n=1 Tax=Sphingobacterium lactis TaxID=797291 RepID=A0A1H6CRB2_9SPHI|nr:hypothetical protein [Sphingobacterium lactis]SEG75398.1 hypothetical protein SAMN05421877_1199 [Sphingobacterium lactis]